MTQLAAEAVPGRAPSPTADAASASALPQRSAARVIGPLIQVREGRLELRRRYMKRPDSAGTHRLSGRALRGFPGELDAEGVADVDLGMLGQPRAGAHRPEHRCQPLVTGIGQVHDAPAVQRLRLGAADRVLDVEQRLAGARAQECAAGAGQFVYAKEGDLLLVVVEEGPFQDELVLLRAEPQPVHRAPVQVLATIAAAPVPGPVAAGV